MGGGGDIMSIVSSEALNIAQQITQQSKKCDDQLSQIRSVMGSTITQGMYEGQGAEAFSQYMLTKYIPDVLALIAAIAGMSTGMINGLDMFDKADSSAMGQVQGVVEGFSFFAG